MSIYIPTGFECCHIYRQFSFYSVCINGLGSLSSEDAFFSSNHVARYFLRDLGGDSENPRADPARTGRNIKTRVCQCRFV